MKAKRVFPALMGLVLVLQFAFALALPMNVSAVSAPSDDAKQLYDEIVRSQTIVALTNCMNRKDQDRGGDEITYADAAAGNWFQDSSMIYVGHIVGGTMSCNSIVQSVASYLGDTPIGLLCRFVPATKNGEAECGPESQVPGIKDYSFQALDWPYRDASGVQGDESVRYSDKYWKNVLIDAFSMTPSNYLSGAAKYYMYQQAFMDPSYCQATSTATSTSGWSNISVNVLVKKLQYVPVEGVDPIDLGNEMKSKPYYYKPNTTSGINSYPTKGNSSSGGGANTSLTTQVVLYPITGLPASSAYPLSYAVVGKEYSSVISSATTQYFKAGTYTIGPDDEEHLRLSDNNLSGRGIYGNGDLYEGDWLYMHYEFMDCAAMANGMNDNSADFNIWRQDKNVGAAPVVGDETLIDPDAAPTSCAIEGIGWIICPVMDFLSTATDAMYGIVSKWLEVDVSLIDTGTGTYNGWTAMRNLANVGFVIVFLIIIFSQITSIGLTNYGIKKLLPKLVIVVILINISFFVTQLAVDISNILGAALKDFIGGTAVFGDGASGFLANGTVFTDTWVKLSTASATLVAGAAVAVGAVAYGGIGLLVMVLLSALLAVATTMLILAARMAMIVVLIVVAPLAFLAMILPNTKKWYDKWLQMFTSMLLIYPMIAIVFGASEMAANILVQSGEDDILLVLLGLAVATVPLFATIPMIKGSLNAIPVLGDLAQKAIKASSAPLSNGINARAKAARTNFGNSVRSNILKTSGGGAVGSSSRWLAGGRARRAASDRNFASEAARTEAGYVADRALAEGSGASDYQKSAAVAAKKKIADEEIASAKSLMEFEGNKAEGGALSHAQAQLVEAIQKGDAIKARVATSMLADAGEVGRNMFRETLMGKDDKPGMESMVSGENYGSDVSLGIRTELAALGVGKSDTVLGTWSHGAGGTVKTMAQAIERAASDAGFARMSLADKASQDEVRLSATTPDQLSAEEARAILGNPALASTLTAGKKTFLQERSGAAAGAKAATTGDLTISHGGPSDTTTGS